MFVLRQSSDYCHVLKYSSSWYIMVRFEKEKKTIIKESL